jgi:DNA-binding LacI/PurR family transcriptional regulator
MTTVRKTKRSTSQDVAIMAGVSRTTVSFVLNRLEGVSISENTRQRVLKAAKTLNYYPNSAGRKLVSGKSNALGLVLYQSPEQVFADAFLARVILGVEQAAMQEKFHVLVKPVEPDDAEGYSKLIHENHVDGIILSGPRQDDSDIIRLHKDGVPIMLLGQLPGTDICFVDVDAINGAETAVRQLLELGHRRIAMITNAPLTYTSAQQRRTGYLNALRARSIEAESLLVKEGNYTPSSGYRAMIDLLRESPRPTAVFVASDVVAAGAILAAKRAGMRIPEDLAIVGFDDIPMAEFLDPPLTTVRLPAFGLGWAASDRLIRLIQGEGLDQNGVFLDTELVVRESAVACNVPI